MRPARKPGAGGGRRVAALVAAVAAVALVGACTEINQQEKTEKIYAGKKDEKPYDGTQFGGDKGKWEVAMQQRNRTQNEYLRVEPAPK